MNRSVRLSLKGFNTIYSSLDDEFSKGLDGSISHGHHRQTNDNVAIKKTDIKPRILLSEIPILESLKNTPNIVRLHNWTVSQSHIHMAFELAECDLDQFLKHKYNANPMPVQMAQMISVQILSGLAELHSLKYAHKDMKPKNCLVFKSGGSLTVKIADFGFGTRIKSPSLQKLCGTNGYIAPELFLDKPIQYPFKIDIWSVGIILYRLFCNGSAFGKYGSYQNIRKLCRSKPNWRINNVNHNTLLVGSAQDLLSGMMTLKPKHRFSLAKCCKHKFLNNTYSVYTLGTLLETLKEATIECRSDVCKNINKFMVICKRDNGHSKKKFVMENGCQYVLKYLGKIFKNNAIVKKQQKNDQIFHGLTTLLRVLNAVFPDPKFGKIMNEIRAKQRKLIAHITLYILSQFADMEDSLRKQCVQFINNVCGNIPVVNTDTKQRTRKKSIVLHCIYKKYLQQLILKVSKLNPVKRHPSSHFVPLDNCILKSLVSIYDGNNEQNNAAIIKCFRDHILGMGTVLIQELESKDSEVITSLIDLHKTCRRIIKTHSRFEQFEHVFEESMTVAFGYVMNMKHYTSELHELLGMHEDLDAVVVLNGYMYNNQFDESKQISICVDQVNSQQPPSDVIAGLFTKIEEYKENVDEAWSKVSKLEERFRTRSIKEMDGLADNNNWNMQNTDILSGNILGKYHRIPTNEFMTYNPSQNRMGLLSAINMGRKSAPKKDI